MKKTILTLVALVIIGCSGYYAWWSQQPTTLYEIMTGHKPEYMTIERDVPWREQTRDLKIGDLYLRVPKAYIDAHLESGLVQDGLLLEFMWPDFRPDADFATYEERKAMFKQRQSGGILILPPPNRTEYNRRREIRHRYLNHYVDAGELYGLHREKQYGKSPDGPVYKYDTYYELDAGDSILSYVECSTEENSRYPSCRHYFKHRKLYMQIYYNKKRYLENWREMRQKAINFIDQFEIQEQQVEEN
jgi:uncharacterized protein YxeA